MATLIVDDCINCGACEPVCPNRAISPGEQMHVIDPERCTECVGFHGEEQCARACPVDSCLPDPDREEDEATLIARARRLHPHRAFEPVFPSRFRVVTEP
jgi:ferredoxin